MHRARSDLKGEHRRAEMWGDYTAKSERRDDDGRKRRRSIEYTHRSTDCSAKRASVRHLTVFTSRGVTGLAWICSVSDAYDLEHGCVCLRWRGVGEVQNRAECKQKTQNHPRPPPTRRTFRGPLHALALLHQIRTPFGADRSAANGILSAIAADALIEIKPLVGSDGGVNNPYSPHCCVLRSL